MAERDRTPLPPEFPGNGARRAVLEYDVADAPAIAHALRIGATTAMMSGGVESVRRLIHYEQTVAAASPTDHKVMDREEAVCEIGIALSVLPEWRVRWRKEREYSRRGRGWVEIGRRSWPLEGWMVEWPAVQRAAALVESIAPPEAVRLPDLVEVEPDR